ncbi:carbohydrate ABC transporter membrane protein 1 (CUT1 family) [Oceanotoga teriensis]|jgi:multiple sugar transport system permease protein|uniref:Carbohydrate ABC transporter membrane protein 1 (CUT1 family) n=2 Tax=Petrotogaceae TaxID=1643949 RepID=A0AA45C752_9BACT|nr:carbohydrate ABC transporter membrane protein 1 (CUT1 family) [Oceanotoga teriensis]
MGMKKGSLERKYTITAYTFLFVPIIFFLVVRFLPMIFSLAMSFTDWNLLSKDINFIGFENFAKIFSDEVFLKSLWNTIKYVIFGVPLVIFLSLIIAVMLNRIRKFQWLFRLLYVMPYITPLVAVSWVWRWFYQPPPMGVFNSILLNLNLSTQQFLGSTEQALFCIVITTVWVQLGYCIVIFLAGLQTIPLEYIEAARIDGASRRQITWKIVVPLLKPITLFLVVMQSISFLRIFTQVYNMSVQGSGGPLNSTKPLVLYIYEKAFVNFDMGLASSASLILFALIMFITFIQMKFLNEKS